MRAIVIVGDGMADRPLKDLEYKTPLDAAGLRLERTRAECLSDSVIQG